jgi:TIR domain-containing protein
VEKLFISYSREDHAAAREIFDTLLNRPDIDPWLDEKRLNLVPYDADIRKRIEASSYILALISAASLSSVGYVATEWAYALEKQKRVLPFLLDRSAETNSQAPAILQGVREINWVRAYESLEEGKRKLLREIYGDLARGAFRDTFSSLGPDNEDWRLDGWALDDADADNRNSQSIRAEVAPSFYSQRHVRVAAISFSLGNWSRIAYARKLTLRRANTYATARFRISLTDGSHVIPIEDINPTGDQLDYNDEDWERVERTLDLTRLSGRNATLSLTLSASDTIAMPLTKGAVNIDNIWID